MNTGLSLVSEIIERRDRLKAQHADALMKRQAATQGDSRADQAYYKGLEEGLDRALIHLDWLVDLARQGEK